jgi:CheY-like chemotaxis protein
MHPIECLRVLFAEDDPMVGDAIEAVLQAAGCVVARAADGLEALEQAAGRVFDLLVTDLDMPRLDGAALIRDLRAARPSLPVLVVTGAAPPEGPDALTRPGEGPLLLLEKPAKPQAIRAALAALTDACRAGPVASEC